MLFIIQLSYLVMSNWVNVNATADALLNAQKLVCFLWEQMHGKHFCLSLLHIFVQKQLACQASIKISFQKYNWHTQNLKNPIPYSSATTYTTGLNEISWSSFYFQIVSDKGKRKSIFRTKVYGCAISLQSDCYCIISND